MERIAAEQSSLDGHDSALDPSGYMVGEERENVAARPAEFAGGDVAGSEYLQKPPGFDLKFSIYPLM